MADVPCCGNAAKRAVAASPPSDRPWCPLRGRSDFRRVFRDGSRNRSGGITIVRAAGLPGSTRVGVVAGRKVGNAVQRNRAKRRLREALRRVRLEPGVDYVVIAGPAVARAAWGEVMAWMETGIGARGEEA